MTEPEPGPNLARMALGRLLYGGAIAAFLGWLTIKQLLLMRQIGFHPVRELWLVTLAPTLALVSPVLWLKGRRQIAALFGIDAIITLLLYTNVVYFRQFRDLFSVASVRYAGQLGEVRGAVFTLLHPSDLLYAVDLLLLAALLLFRRWKLPRWVAPRWGWVALAGMVVGVAMAGQMIVTDPGRTEIWSGPTAVAKRIGVLNYQVVDVWRYSSRMTQRLHPSPTAVAEVKDWFASSTNAVAKQSSPMYGAFKGANVIYLQVESLHNFVINLKVNGQEITPNLNRLEGETVRFPDFYTQIGQGTTADAEFLANCSMYPAPSGAVYVDYAGNKFNCLPGLLRTQGYETAVMHSDRPDFWNRATVYPSIGVDRFFNVNDYVQDEHVVMGLGDNSFLRQSAEKLKQLPQPFQAMVITLSSHAPYEDNGIAHTLNLGDLEGTKAGDYLQTIHYVDAAIGRFIDQLKQNGLMDHTVLMIYGDHTILRRDEPSLAKLLNLTPQDELAWARVENQVPLFIRLPDGRSEERTDPAGEIDLAPTVAGLLGVPTDKTFFMGRDLFAQPTGTVVLHNGSTITADHVYLADANAWTGACYSRQTGATLPLANCLDTSQQAKKTLSVSSRILNLNLQPEHG